MRIPLATYRLQFTPVFTFLDAQSILEYLSELGITDIYASPIFKPSKGSHHGYDMVDPTQINPQLGGEGAFDRLLREVKRKDMGWIQDIVPNHMAFDSENRLLMDIFENGSMSKYYQFFDIQWDHPYENLKGKMLVPFLGDFYGRCLENGEIQLSYDQEGLNVRYYDWRWPLKMETYLKILAHDLMSLENKIPRENPDYIKFLEMIQNLGKLADFRDPNERYGQGALLKLQLWQLYSSNPAIKEYIDAVIAKFNGSKGNPRSFDALDGLLSEQLFRLSFWKVGNEELNYRRFFTINGLASLQIEKKEVFEYIHAFIFRLISEGKITGLRVDHIDGLYDPYLYLRQIREQYRSLYIVVEKVLDFYEEFPAFFPVAGTTGYDFLNIVNEVFVEKRHQKAFTRAYMAWTGNQASYRELVVEKKRLFMGRYMAGDIDNLAHLLKRILSLNRHGKDMTMYALRRAIVEIMAQFPVYRCYMSEHNVSEADKIHIKEAVTRAQNHNPGLMHEINFIGKVLLLDFGNVPEEDKEQYYHFTKKFQQFSGPLMAKGAEDTAFYIYNRFISLNEVGGDPSVFGLSLENFHEYMTKRQRLQPHSMSATSTHDTKRGEDLRARLNVISEIPKEWVGQVRVWHRYNKDKRKKVGAIKAPDKNDEYLIYMTLLGAYPFEEGADHHEQFIQRMKEYIIKAVREAKVHTGWLKPDHEYENACTGFVEALLRRDGGNDFWETFYPFQRKVAAYGILNSLSQALLKLTSPGVPDIYQGGEFWDFSLVDPDNRRPVNYDRRVAALKEIQTRRNDPLKFIAELLASRKDGRIKLFLIHKILQARRQYMDLFLKGEYVPLRTRGRFYNHILAFARKNSDFWSLSIVPRFLTSVISEEELPLGDKWDDTTLILPAQTPQQWENVITQQTVVAGQEIPLGKLLNDFPAALLVSKNQ